MRILTMLFLALSITACAASSGIEAGAIGALGPNGETTYTTIVSVGNRGLARRIAVTKVDEQRIGDLLRTSVTLKSMTSQTEALQYRWTWFDAKGFEVNSSSQAWQPLLVYGQQTASVQGLAPNPAAKSFKLHLRYQD